MRRRQLRARRVSRADRQFIQSREVMSETRFIALGKIFAFSAVVEIATGIGLIVAPAIFVALLVRGEIGDLV